MITHLIALALSAQQTIYLQQSPAQKAALADLLAKQQDRSSPHYHKWLSPDVSTAALIDLMIMTTCEDPERYAQLSEPNINTRARWLERRLRDTRETIVTAAKFSPQERDDGISLN